MYFTIIFLKEDNPAVFHIIVTHLCWGPFSGLNARSPFGMFAHILSLEHHFRTFELQRLWVLIRKNMIYCLVLCYATLV